jgi:hypothetical protein
MVANMLSMLALSALGFASISAAPADPSGQMSLGNFSQALAASAKKPAGALAAASVTPAWDYGGSKKVRGVNLGWVRASLALETGN